MNYAEGIRKFVPDWNLIEVAESSTKEWFHQHSGRNLEISSLVDPVIEGNGFGESGCLSLAQWCEAMEERKVLTLMSNDEMLRIISNRRPGCNWIRSIPLGWKKWEMSR